MRCAVCRQWVPEDSAVCPLCGFPYSCDLTPIPVARLRTRSSTWRTLLGLAAIFLLISTGVFNYSSNDTYMGYTSEVVSRLAPDVDSGIPLHGPDIFVERTELTLALLKLRAPDFYWRMQDSVRGIAYLAPSYLESEAGKRISLEGIGALSEPATGQVQVLSVTAFPSGVAEFYDHDVFSYAGTLIHELRHIELHASQQAPGGWQEEWLCEKAAYDAERQMGAPKGVLLRYELYLDEPQAKRYQGWYKWYQQWQ
jgi:hypothetical protein